MNLNIYLEDTLAKQVKESAHALGKSRNAVIREAVKEWLFNHKAHAWPESIKRFKGIKDIPRFESYREELLPPKDDPLA